MIDCTHSNPQHTDHSYNQDIDITRVNIDITIVNININIINIDIFKFNNGIAKVTIEITVVYIDITSANGINDNTDVTAYFNINVTLANAHNALYCASAPYFGAGSFLTHHGTG